MHLPHQPRPVLRRSPRWTGARALIATVLLTASAGCAAAAASSSPAPAGAVSSGAVSSGAAQSPGAVGLAYTRYLFAGNFSQARSLVLPADRNIITILFTGLSSGSFRTQNLAVGSVATKGSSATVILTGKICSSGAAPKNVTNAPRPNEECQENKDPKSANPAFRVSLCNSGHTWYVCFPRPNSGGGEQASSTAGASATHG
jgi:hypothetical protein